MDSLGKLMMGLACACAWPFSTASAQIAFQEQYTKVVKGGESVDAYDAGLFGDRVSPSVGGLDFHATDISLPGTGDVPVAFSRRRAVENRGGGFTGNDGGLARRLPMGDWDWDLPLIEGVFQAGRGWTTGSSVSPTNRCSGPAAPAPWNVDLVAPPPYPVNGWQVESPRAFWEGIHLRQPGNGRQEVLFAQPGAVADTPADGKVYRWVTSDRWHLACLPTLANGAGEGFIARSPDGLVYTFDWLVKEWAPAIVWPGTRQTGSLELPRERWRLYPTQVADRHGNWVRYAWSNGRLQSITSKDGRVISLTHDGPEGRIDSVSDNSRPVRIWRYGYDGVSGHLRRVDLPDGSAWELDFGGFGWGRHVYEAHPPTIGLPPMDYSLRCNWMPLMLAGANRHVISVKHPSGALGKFTLELTRHGRANVQSIDCSTIGNDYQLAHNAETPARFDTWSIVEKRVSGPGIPEYRWVYDYELPIGNFTSNGAACATCPTTKAVTVTDPDGARTKSTFGIDFGRTDGQLLAVEIKNASGREVRKETFEYVLDGQATPFRDRIGTSPQVYLHDSYFGERVRPQRSRTIVQEGVTYRRSVETFDVLAYPARVTRTNSLGYGRNEDVVHDHNLGVWVIGRQGKLTIDRKVVSETMFDPLTAMPMQVWSFGRRLQSLSWHADGNLHTVTDGAQHTTVFTDYFRGVARRVDYPTRTFQAADVNNYGAITAIRDELGNETRYDYWPHGRLKTITPPSGDDVRWNPTSVDFVQVAGADLGVAGGHWKQTITKGRSSVTTIFDALWRPLLVTKVADGSTTHVVTRHDHRGKETFASYPRESVTSIPAVADGVSRAYDALGRLESSSQTSELGTLLTRVEYPGRLRRSVTNARNRVTTTSFMAFDEPSEEWPVGIAAPETVSTSIDRDIFGKARSITRSGTRLSDGTVQGVSVTRTYVYDVHERLCKTIEPEVGATVVDYDGADNIAWEAVGLALPDAGSCDRNAAGVSAVRSHRTYDELGRPLTSTFADGSPGIVRTYWEDGRLKTLTSGAVRWTYDYNKLRLPTSELLEVDGARYALENRYSPNGHLRTLVYPDAVEVDFAPDGFGRPTQARSALRSYASAVRLHPDGAIKSYSYGNGIAHTSTQNARGLPLRNLHAPGVVDNTYGYDEHANVLSIADPIAGSSRTMSYDGLDRLRSVTAGAPWSNAIYEYDGVDNLRKSRVAGRHGAATAVHHYGTTTNLLEAVSVNGLSTTYAYARGNLSQRGAELYTFDHANRLVSTSMERSGGSERYAYDGHGRRVKVVRTASGATRHMVYALDGQLRFEHDLATGKLTDYIHLAGKLIAREESGLPGIPTPPVVTAPATNATGSYLVTWTAPTGSASFVLRERKDADAWVEIYSGSANGSQLSLRGNGRFEYQAKACNSAGCSAFGPVATTTVAGVHAPSAPTAILGNPNPSHTGNYEVRWTAVPGATLYRVQENTGAGWGVAYLYTGPDTFHIVTDKPTGTYGYRVEACTASCSAPSASVGVSVSRSNALGAPVLTVPAQSTTGSFTISWTPVGGASSYQLQEFVPGNWAWVNAYTGYTHSRTFTRSNGVYRFQIRTCAAQGVCGDYGPPSRIEVTIGGVPLAPATLTVHPAENTTGNTELRWDASAGAVRYVLQRSSNGGARQTVFSGNGLVRSESSLVLGTHEYWVKACSGGDELSCGAERGPTIYRRTAPGVQPPDPVPWITVTPATSTNGAYRLAWGAPAGATHYVIHESRDGSPFDCPAELPCRTDAPVTSMDFSGRGNGRYEYRIAACRTGATIPCTMSTISAVVDVAIPNGPSQPAWISTNASGCAVAPRNFRVSWAPSTNATRYELRERVEEDGDYVQDMTVLGTYIDLTRSTRYNAGVTLESVRYQHQVRGCNAAGQCSAWRGTATTCVTRLGGPREVELVNTVRFLHTDMLGSPVAETDENGLVVRRLHYEAYGAPVDGSTPNGPGFTGHVADEASGLVYMQQRYYDPLAGRFLSLDPIVADSTSGYGFNRFAYANSSPLTLIDPDGRSTCANVDCSMSTIDEVIPRFNLQSPPVNGMEGLPVDIASGVEMGYVTKISFYNDVPGGASANTPIETKTANMVEAAVTQAGVDSININSTTGGSHSQKSNHYKNRAVDINRVDGKKVDKLNAGALRIQEAARDGAMAKENFGPNIVERTSTPGGNPVHFSNKDVSRNHANHLHLAGHQ